MTTLRHQRLTIDARRDDEANAASLRFSPETGRQLRTFPIDVDGGLAATITFTPEGKLVELELLNVSAQLPHPPAADESLGHDGSMTSYSRTKEFEGATFDRCSFKGARMRYPNVSGVTMRGASVDGLDIDDHDLFFGSLIVNGVDVVPLVDAELNRQFPGRELQKATTLEGLREGWEKARSAWAETVASTPAELRDAVVDDEWSLAQALRHLVLATDAWLGRGIRRDEQPFHPIGQVFAGFAEAGYDTSFLREPAGWEEILTVRAERQQQVTDYLAGVKQAELDAPASNPWGESDDWVPTAGDCLRVILEEEWAHLRYAGRDLARLQTEPAAS